MIKKTKKQYFVKLIKDHPLEDYELIAYIGKYLKHKRKYICKMPPKGSDVILLLSGGIDSISSWAILLEEYKLRVNPICINTGQKRHKQELKSVKYFSDLFRKRYPKLFVEPFFMSFPSSAPEISKALRGDLSKTIHPEVLKDNYNSKTRTTILTRKYLFSAYFPFPAAIASYFFDLSRNIKVRTIFCSILPEDGLLSASQTLTSMRSATLALIGFTKENSWQVVSVCFEKELGLCLHKSDLILWSYEHDIPIEKAYSCQKGKALHCGICSVCKYRKQSFLDANIPDKTIYLDQKIIFTKRFFKPLKTISKPIKFIYTRFLKTTHSDKNKKIFIKDYY
jgi:hypothetical protein